jgi:hypothetical protein
MGHIWPVGCIPTDISEQPSAGIILMTGSVRSKDFFAD